MFFGIWNSLINRVIVSFIFWFILFSWPYFKIGMGIYPIIIGVLAWIPVGVPIFIEALKLIRKKQYFTEFSLMVLASISAFLLGDYAEGTALMLFYNLGEWIQGKAVLKSKSKIKSVLDARNSKTEVWQGNQWQESNTLDLQKNMLIRLKPGQVVPAEGILESEFAFIDLRLLTGEPHPIEVKKGAFISSGTVMLLHDSKILLTHSATDSQFTHLLNGVQQAVSKKAPTELALRTFAKYYTPTVFFIALMVFLILPFAMPNVSYIESYKRALVLLVIACPCALLISVPLGYFGGIAASFKRGILIKGAYVLDKITKIESWAFDKTGTLTTGQINQFDFIPENENVPHWKSIIKSLEFHSQHPIAQSFIRFAAKEPTLPVIQFKEIINEGVEGIIENSFYELKKQKFDTPQFLEINTHKLQFTNTIELKKDGIKIGQLIFEEEIPKENYHVINKLKNNHNQVIILSGDKEQAVQKIALALHIEEYHANMSPKDKTAFIRQFITQNHDKIALVGDGFNDAEAMANSYLGITIGSEEGASQTASYASDVTLLKKDLTRILELIKIGKKTKRIIFQNIILALSIKFAVTVMGIYGATGLWEALFADVGVALLAILNSMRTYFSA